MGAARAAHRRCSAISIPLLGGYMAKVYGDGKAPGDRVFLPVERLDLPRLPGRSRTASSAGPSTRSRCSRSASSACSSCTRCSGCRPSLPFNPTHAPQVGEALSFNTATSFVTNTNWQSYSPESTLSNLTQMVGLDGAELRLGRGRHGGHGRADPRARPAALRHDRQLLGRPHPHDAAHPPPDRVRRRARLRQHRRGPELPRLRGGQDPRGQARR